MIHAARAGDLAQRARVLEVYRPYLIVVAISKIDPSVQSKSAPSDAAQDTIIKAFDAFSDFEGKGPNSLLRWLDKIHSNALHDLHRRYIGAKMRDVHGEVPLDGQESSESLSNLARAIAKDDTPSVVLSKREWAARIHSAISQLPNRQKEVITLRYLRQMRFPLIAREIGITEKAARMAAIRGLAALKHMFLDSDGDE